MRSQGYKILVRNFRTKIGELDIVCRKGNVTVFVEVKTVRAGNDAYSPELHFTQNKLRKMQRAALLFFKMNRLSPEAAMRFDLVAVEIGTEKTKPLIRHYENLGA